VVSVLLFVAIVVKSFSWLGEQLEMPVSDSSEEYSYIAGSSNSQNKLLSIKIDGVIYSSRTANDPFDFLFPGTTYGYTIKDILTKAAEDPDIKGVILEIDSPGGTINGSRAIYDGVKYFKTKSGKPVLAFIEGIGASGAYMSAIAADYITADHGSLTGSIGVIMGPFKYYNKVISESDFVGSVATENGIEYTYITGGEDKEFGSPYKPLSEKARNIMQQNVDTEYQSFVELVSTDRNISRLDITQNIGALVYENTQAKELGLIDEIKNKHESYNHLANMSGITSSDYQIVGYKENDLWSSIFSGVLSNFYSAETLECRLCNQMLFLYGEPRIF
jgi:protease-4